MVRQLLETCVDEEWVRELEIEGLEPLPTNLVDERLMRRQCDLLLRARLRGREVYVLILLEFQSSPDRFMALRLLAYICSAWLSLVERSRTDKGSPAFRELPPVFPVVLYNGERAWNAPRRLEELVADAELGDLSDYVPRFTHHLIEERTFPNERLEEARNLISALFTLERTEETSLEERVAKVAAWLRGFAGKNPELVARFMSWVRARFHEDNRREYEVRAEDIKEPGRIETMLETAIKERAQKERAEGREEGRREKELEIARKLLARGMSPSEVAESTGLPLDEIQKLAH